MPQPVALGRQKVEDRGKNEGPGVTVQTEHTSCSMSVVGCIILSRMVPSKLEEDAWPRALTLQNLQDWQKAGPGRGAQARGQASIDCL